MNLALHGFLLQVFVSILNFQHGSLLCSAGEPGYLDFDNLPETNFSCQGKVIGGYYADVEAGCQMFHVCTIGQKDEIMDIKFLCLNGTVFDQETRVCERVDEVDCSKSERFYNLNLELYGNNAVTLSLHENNEDEEDPIDSIDDHQQRTTSARPVTTTTTTTTTPRPNKTPTTPTASFSHPTGYPQHYQPQPPFPQVHTSQSKSLYDDKNGGYHHQYIFHSGERNNNQATSYQLFSNQGVSSTTIQAPQVHQIRFSSTSSPQIIHNEPSTVSPLFHTPSTIQTLLNSNANSPALINPIFHNHGIASTTEQFSLHSNNPRETSDYRETNENIRPLEAVQSTNKGKVSKLTISPVPSQPEPQRSTQTKTSQSSQQQQQQQQQQRISSSFLPTPPTIETTIRSFYPTPRTSSKPTQASQSTSGQVATQHIHIPPSVPIPQLKPHQITINLPPPDIQRIVQNPSPLLPSQSRVIVTAKASVSDESGRPLNSSQLVTLPLPTIPASYDDYKEGDVSFDPFYRDVPKIRTNRRVSNADGVGKGRMRRSLGQSKASSGPFVYDANTNEEERLRVLDIDEEPLIGQRFMKEKEDDALRDIKESLMKYRRILFSEEDTESEESSDEKGEDDSMNLKVDDKVSPPVGPKRESSKDLQIRASKYSKARKFDEDEYEAEDNEEEENEDEKSEMTTVKSDVRLMDEPEDVPVTESPKRQSRYRIEKVKENKDKNVKEEAQGIDEDNINAENLSKLLENKRILDIVILAANQHMKLNSAIFNRTAGLMEKKDLSGISSVIARNEEKMRGRDEENSELKQKLESRQNLDRKQNSGDKEDSTLPHKATNVEISAKTNKKMRTEKEVEERGNPGGNNDKDRNEQKPSSKRISARIRSRGRSSRRKQKNNSAEKQKISEDQKLSPAGTTSTTTPAYLESTVAKISRHIFDEPESKTPRGLDIRAVEHRAKNNVPSSQDSKTRSELQKNGKVKDPEYPKLESHDTLSIDLRIPSKPEKDTIEIEFERKEESEDSGTQNTGELVENEETATEQPEKMEDNANVYVKEKTTFEHVESAEDMETTVKKTLKEAEGDVKSSHHVRKSSRRGKSMKFEESVSTESNNHREDKSRKFNDEVGEVSVDLSTTTSVENVESNEDISEFFAESTYEPSTEDSGSTGMDFSEVEGEERSTVAREDHWKEESDTQGSTTEGSTEESVTAEEERSTEGVLKFTDELPKIDKKEESTVESKSFPESTENIAQDYVDDNYEPENYKEPEYSTESNELSDEKSKKDVLEDVKESDEDAKESDEGAKESDEGAKETDEDDQEFDEHSKGSDEEGKEFDEDAKESDEDAKESDEDAKESDEDAKESDEDVKGSNEEVKESDEGKLSDEYTKESDEDIKETDEEIKQLDEELKKSDEDDNDSAENLSKASTESEEDINSTEDYAKSFDETFEDEEEETTTITSTSSTSTTIRPTPPKLFKPIAARKNYNYIPPTTTPNPVIIKPRLPLVNPKPAKPPKSYNDLVPKPVIRKLPLLARKYTTTRTTTTRTTTTEDSEDDIESTTLISTTTAVDATRSDENTLEGKLEAKINEEIPRSSLKTTAGKDDQFPSPSERKTPPNISHGDGREISTTAKDRENFTPYPIMTKLSSLASAIGETLQDATTSMEERTGTTPRPVSFLDVNIISTTSSPTTLAPKKLMVIDSGNLEVVIEDSTLLADSPLSVTSARPSQVDENESTAAFEISDSTIGPEISTMSPTTSTMSPTTSTMSSSTSTMTHPTSIMTPTSSVSPLTSSISPQTSSTSPPTSASPQTSSVGLQTSSVSPQTSTISPPSSRMQSSSSAMNPSTLSSNADMEDGQTMDTTTVRLYHKKVLGPRRHNSFNCLEKEMYRFYGDTRDCRLFHYCSPGFTSRQVLDFRFVCEEGTAFDEDSQSCRHDVRNERCPNRSW